MDSVVTLLFAFIVLITMTIDGITGFGGTLLAMPFLEPLVSFKLAVPALAMLNLFLSGYWTVATRKDIVKKQWLILMILMVIGLPFGMWMFAALPERPLKLCLAIVMVYTAIKGLAEIRQPHLRSQSSREATGVRKYLFYVIAFLGGVMQGAFTCGGPFVVIYATMAFKNKAQFRATLFAVWLSINSIITVKNAVTGALTPEVLTLVFWTVPAMFLAVVFSSFLQKKIQGQAFNQLVYGVLLGAGIIMFF